MRLKQTHTQICKGVPLQIWVCIVTYLYYTPIFFIFQGIEPKISGCICSFFIILKGTLFDNCDWNENNMSDIIIKNDLRFTEKDRHLFSAPAREVAPWLLGKVLCHQLPDGKILRARITETEAYPASDSACYGRDNEKTDATMPLFGEGGVCCIYAGMLLIVCGHRDERDNVLIRKAGNEKVYYDGPIKVCEGLKIDKKNYHGKNLLAVDSTLWLEVDPMDVRHCKVQRVGLGFNVKEEDRIAPLRFIAL